MCTFCDDVKSFFPVLYFFSSAFGADDEVGVLVLTEHFYHLFYQMVLVSAVDGDAANLFQEPADDRLEELLFHHYFEFDVVVTIEIKTHKEVGDGSMWRHNAHGIAKVGGNVINRFPSANLESEFSYSSLKAHSLNSKLPDCGSFFGGDVHLVLRLDVEGFIEVRHRA